MSFPAFCLWALAFDLAVAYALLMAFGWLT